MNAAQTPELIVDQAHVTGSEKLADIRVAMLKSRTLQSQIDALRQQLSALGNQDSSILHVRL